MTRHYLADLSAASSDEQIGKAIVGHLLSVENPAGPFKLGYKFDANKAAPPVKCDRLVQGKLLCAIERKDKEFCRTWLLHVLGQGLYVQRFALGQGYLTPVAGDSINGARRTLEARERMAAFDKTRVIGDDGMDDEIPF